MREVVLIIGLCLVLCLLAVPLLCALRLICAIFSPKIRITIRKEWKSHALLVATSVVILVASSVFFLFALRVGPSAIRQAKLAKTQNEATQIQTAILGYYTEYAEMPPSSDNATLIKILTGNNPRANTRRIAFLYVRPDDLNAKGEMVDAWKNPFRISFIDPDHVIVTSDMLPSGFKTDVDRDDH